MVGELFLVGIVEKYQFMYDSDLFLFNLDKYVIVFSWSADKFSYYPILYH